MTKLSLNKAAAYAGKAKADILKALKSNELDKKLSGEKNAKGHWEIEESELDRFFGKKDATLVPTGSKNGSATPEITSQNNSVEVEVKLLREQIDKIESMHERERGILSDQIEDLKAAAERQSAEHMQALAVLTDQREKPAERRGWFSFGRK